MKNLMGQLDSTKINFYLFKIIKDTHAQFLQNLSKS